MVACTWAGVKNNISKRTLAQRQSKHLRCWLPPNKLYTRKWLECFQDVVMFKLSVALANKAKATTLQMLKGAASVITDVVIEHKFVLIL